MSKQIKFDRHLRLALTKMLTNQYEAGKHLESARLLRDKRSKDQRRVLQAAFRCFVDIHQALPMAWNGPEWDS